MRLARFALLLGPMAGFALAGASTASAAEAPAPPRPCAQMAGMSIAGVAVSKADDVPAAAPGTVQVGFAPNDRNRVAFPAYCRVEGVIDARTGADGKSYGLTVAIALPDDWNGRFLMMGGGGLNGNLAAPLGATASGDRPALARARLVLKSDPQEAAYQGWLAYYRMQWDAYHCTDPSASQGLAIIVTEMHDADPNFLSSISDPARKLAAFKRLLAEDAVFAAPSRPWWICSHGMNAVMSGARAGWSRPDSELADRRERWRSMIQGQIAEMEASAR